MKTTQTIWFPDLEATIAVVRNLTISQERLDVLEPLIQYVQDKWTEGNPITLNFICMARHTFATTITLRHGMSLEVLSKVLGHKNLRSTQHYGKIMNHRIMDEMKTVAAKLNPSKLI